MMGGRYQEREQPGDWIESGACRGASKGLFFTESTETEAVAICQGCAVRPQCLAYGMGERFGVWGGATESERERLRRARGLPVGRRLLRIVDA